MIDLRKMYSGRYILTVMIIGWLLAFLCVIIMGYFGGVAYAYNNYEYVGAVIISVMLAITLGSLLATHFIGTSVPSYVLLIFAVTLLIVLVIVALHLKEPRMWTACILLPAAVTAIGWASGTSRRYAYDKEVHKFQQEVTLKKRQQELSKAEKLALKETAKDLHGMLEHNGERYERAVVKAVLDLAAAAPRDPISLRSIANVSNCRLTLAKLMLNRFESEGWIQTHYQQERTSWEDQTIEIKDNGAGLRKYYVNSKDSTRKGGQFNFYGPVTGQNFGTNTGNNYQNISAENQGTQKNRGLEAADVIEFRKAVTGHLGPEISEHDRDKILKELDELDHPSRGTEALSNLGKIFEGLGKIGEPLLRAWSQFNT